MGCRLLAMLLLAAAALVAGTTPAPAAAPDPLAGDSRLTQRITLEARRHPLPDVLKTISQTTGVNLRADRAAARLRVHAFLEQAPLEQTLRRLSTLLHLTWSRVEGKEPPEYLLMQTRADEAALEAAQAEDRRAQRQHLTRLIMALTRPGALGNSPEERMALSWAREPGIGGAIKILAALPEFCLDQLVRDGQLEIPAAEWSPAMAQALDEFCRFRPPVPAAAGVKRLTPDHPYLTIGVGEGRRGGMVVSAQTPDGRQRGMGFNPLQEEPQDQLREQRHWNSREISGNLKGLRLSETGPDHERRLFKARTSLRLDEVLAQFAHLNHVNVLADAYDPDWEQSTVFATWDLPPDAPADLVLDRLCWSFYYTWNAEEPVLLLRKRDWYFARDQQIPADLEQEWRDSAKAPGSYSLEQLTGMALMRRSQREKIIRYAGTEAHFMTNTGLMRKLLLLYAALPSAERRLLRGDGLRADRFNLAQQRLLEPLVRALRPEAVDLPHAFQQLELADDPGTASTTATFRFRDGERRTIKIDRIAHPAPDPWLSKLRVFRID